MSAVLALAAMLAQAGVAELGWLSGRWESRDGERWTEESWSEPRAGTMIGYSRSGRGDMMREFEFIRLQAGEDGVVAYLAQPGGRAPATAFRLTARDGTSATFENPAHDFPQRIVYRRDGETMTATISRLDGSNAISWTFQRR